MLRLREQKRDEIVVAVNLTFDVSLPIHVSVLLQIRGYVGSILDDWPRGIILGVNLLASQGGAIAGKVLKIELTRHQLEKWLAMGSSADVRERLSQPQLEIRRVVKCRTRVVYRPFPGALAYEHNMIVPDYGCIGSDWNIGPAFCDLGG